MNLLKTLREVSAPAPVQIGTVLGVDDATSTIQTSTGVITVRGTGVAVGSKVFYQGAELKGAAPELPHYELEV